MQRGLSDEPCEPPRARGTAGIRGRARRLLAALRTGGSAVVVVLLAHRRAPSVMVRVRRDRASHDEQRAQRAHYEPRTNPLPLTTLHSNPYNGH